MLNIAYMGKNTYICTRNNYQIKQIVWDFYKIYSKKRKNKIGILSFGQLWIYVIGDTKVKTKRYWNLLSFICQSKVTSLSSCLMT